jgi:hypothetical protein
VTKTFWSFFNGGGMLDSDQSFLIAITHMPLFNGNWNILVAMKVRHVMCFWKALKKGFSKNMAQVGTQWWLKKIGCHSHYVEVTKCFSSLSDTTPPLDGNWNFSVIQKRKWGCHVFWKDLVKSHWEVLKKNVAFPFSSE